MFFIGQNLSALPYIFLLVTYLAGLSTVSFNILSVDNQYNPEDLVVFQNSNVYDNICEVKTEYKLLDFTSDNSYYYSGTNILMQETEWIISIKIPSHSPYKTTRGYFSDRFSRPPPLGPLS